MANEKLLNSKRDALFEKINSLFEQSKRITSFDSRSNESFMADSETIDEMLIKFEKIVDSINQINIDSNPLYKPDYQCLTIYSDLHSRIKRVRNKIDSKKNSDIKPHVASQSLNIKLPPIDIPFFDGKTENWPSFYQSFKSNIHENDQLSDSQRVQYLVGKLTHQALKITAGIIPTADTYPILWNALINKYQDKRALGTYYLNNIFDIRSCSHSAVSLNSFVDRFSASIAALKQLGISDLVDFTFLHCALRKIDSQTVQNFELSVRGIEIPTCTDLIKFVQDQAKILEHNNLSPLLRVNAKSARPAAQLMRSPDTYPRAYSTFVNKQAPLTCSLCNKNDHINLYQCLKFKNMSSSRKRFDYIKSQNGCINCLSLKHFVSNCKSKNVCNNCQKRHHTLLHFSNENNSNSYNTESYSNPLASPQKISSNTLVRAQESNPHHATEPSALNATMTLASHSAAPPASCTVLLSTAQIHAYANNNVKNIIRCLIDNGSQCNLITLDCCKKLNLNIEQLSNSFVKGVGLTSRPIYGIVYFNIESRYNAAYKYNIQAFVVDHITDKLPSRFINNLNNSQISRISNIALADLSWNIPGEIDLIIGAQLFPYIYLGNRIEIDSMPSAIETAFGYVFIGDVPCNKQNNGNNNLPIASFAAFVNGDLNTSLQKFWELEEIPYKKILSVEETECEKLFLSSVTRNSEGKYCVALPFCRSSSELGDSRAIAYKRFALLERRLKHDSLLRSEYNNIMNDYIKNDYISETLPSNLIENGYYIPHHIVIRQDKSTTKFRLVLDASSKTHTGLSLNDILHTGPNLQADLFLLLLSFRLFPIALTADIKQMYLRISVPENDRNYLRLLFRFNDEEEIRTFHFNCLPFGLKSSPYLAMRTLRHLAEAESVRFPEAAKAVNTELYMDDLCTSVLNENKATQLVHQLIALFKSGDFDLVKWSSNCSAVLQNLPDTHRASISFSDNNSNLKILGLSWQPQKDCFFISTTHYEDKCTKRTILSFVARLFDVLGLVAPVVLYAKLLIKDLWNNKVDWDEKPHDNIIKRFNLLLNELPLFSKLVIPRHIGVNENSIVNIVAFSDASMNAYGCVVYLHITDPTGHVTVRLLCAKSKVSPVKITTLARLELCAAVLLSKLVKLVRNHYSTRYHISGIYAFSDSTIVLSWINSSPHRWSIFVSNRIAQIHENLSPNCFYHISGEINPSDCLSRGLLPSQLISHNLWWNGPLWLARPVSEWPIAPFSPSDNIQNSPEVKASVLTSSVNFDEINILYNLCQRISSWQKLLRIIVYILRFVKKLPRSKIISVSDLLYAENYIIRLIQSVYFAQEIHNLNKKLLVSKPLRNLCPFIDDEGILRIEGRLSNADVPFVVKHPALLPKRDHVVDILIDHYHKVNCHAGANLLMSIIRQSYWILSARNIIRKRVRSCNRCFRLSPSNTAPKMADLPRCRINEAKAFMHTGIDYAGPVKMLLTRRRGQHAQKAYICLFVCLTTKAVHIELVSDLTADMFIAAFKRFIARRGPVNCLYSDNATNFVGAKAKLNEMYSFLYSNQFETALRSELNNRRIDWKMIPPRAPHFGGIWEANIKSVKTHLYRVVGAQLLTYEELVTILTQIECILNSRPLCVISSDPHPEVLTPAHFLMSTPLQHLPMSDISSSQSSLVNRKKLLDSLILSYWKKWRIEYLHTLQVRQKWLNSDNNIKIGTVVLLHQDDVPPLRWPLGIIQNIYPGKDGVIRVVLVKTNNGTFKRPLVKVYPLPNQ